MIQPRTDTQVIEFRAVEPEGYGPILWLAGLAIILFITFGQTADKKPSQDEKAEQELMQVKG